MVGDRQSLIPELLPIQGQGLYWINFSIIFSDSHIKDAVNVTHICSTESFFPKHSLVQRTTICNAFCSHHGWSIYKQSHWVHMSKANFEGWMCRQCKNNSMAKALISRQQERWTDILAIFFPLSSSKHQFPWWQGPCLSCSLAFVQHKDKHMVNAPQVFLKWMSGLMNKLTACTKNAFDTYHYWKHLGI